MYVKEHKTRHIPSLRSAKPQIMHAQIQGLPARDAFAPPLSSPLCCFKLHQSSTNQTSIITLTSVQIADSL